MDSGAECNVVGCWQEMGVTSQESRCPCGYHHEDPMSVEQIMAGQQTPEEATESIDLKIRFVECN